MFIPIGHEKSVSRYPHVTVSLIVINTVIFFFTMPIVLSQSKVINELNEEKLQLEAMYINEYLNRTGGNYFSLMSKEGYGKFEKAFEDGEIIEKDSEDYKKWTEFKNEIEKKIGNMVYYKLGYIPSNFRLYPLLTSIFIHGGILHLLGNMWFLWLVGCNMEDVWGRQYFLIFYLTSGAVAALMHGAVHPHAEIPCIGASGAIAGTMGAFMIRNYKTNIRIFYWVFWIFMGISRIPAYVVLGAWFLLQLLYGLILIGYACGVAYWAHIGGFLFGAGIAVLLKTKKIEERYIAPKLEEKIEAVKLNPKLTLAFEARDKGDKENAVRLLKEVTKEEPNNIDAYTELANIYLSLDRREEAGDSYDKIVQILSKRREKDTLLSTYEKFKNSKLNDRLNARSLFAIARLLSEREKFEESLVAYKNMINKYPESELVPMAVYRCGLIFKKMDKVELARSSFAYVLNKYPTLSWRETVEKELSS